MTATKASRLYFLPAPDSPSKNCRPVQYADPVEEHGQSNQSDGTHDLCLRRKSSDGQADEQHGTNAEGEAKDVDLPDRIAQTNSEKQRKDRLRADHVANVGQH